MFFIFPIQDQARKGNASRATKLYFPIEMAVFIIYGLIFLGEFIFCLITLVSISEKQGAVFFLRNTKLSISNPKEKIKTSQEIEQELYYKFPYLQKNINNLSDNEHSKNN